MKKIILLCIIFSSFIYGQGIGKPTVSRMINDSLDYRLGSNWVTPQMYGAAMDGTTDDASAIQSALNTGNFVFMPKGTYLIKTSLKITEAMPGIFSEGAIIQTDANSEAGIEIGKTTNVTNFILDNIELKGTSSNDGGIKIGNSSYYVAFLKMNNVTVSGFDKSGAYGIEITKLQEGDFEDCIISGNYNNIYLPNTGVWGTGHYLTATRFHGMSSYIGLATNIGVLIEADNYGDLTFQDLVIESNEREAIKMTAYGMMLILRGVYFEDNAQVDTVAVIDLSSRGQSLRPQLIMTDCKFRGARNTANALVMDSVKSAYIANNQLLLEHGITLGKDVSVYFLNNFCSQSYYYLQSLGSPEPDSVYKSLVGVYETTGNVVVVDDRDSSLNPYHYSSAPREMEGTTLTLNYTDVNVSKDLTTTGILTSDSTIVGDSLNISGTSNINKVELVGVEDADQTSLVFAASDKSDRFYFESNLDGSTANDSLRLNTFSTPDVIVINGSGGVYMDKNLEVNGTATVGALALTGDLDLTFTGRIDLPTYTNMSLDSLTTRVAKMDTMLFAFGISSATGTDYSTAIFLDRAVTIDTIFVVLRTDGGGNDTAAVNIYWGSNLGGSTTTALTSDSSVVNVTTGVAIPVNTASIPARNWVWLQCNHVGGTVNQINATVKGRND